MTRRLDVVREIRNAVMEGNRSLGHRREKVKVESKETGEDIVRWREEVSGHLEDITGMSADDLFPDFDWSGHYHDGLEPEAAAKVVLQAAEEEDDEPDAEEVSEDKGKKDLEQMLSEFADSGVQEEAVQKTAPKKEEKSNDVLRALEAIKRDELREGKANVAGSDPGRWGPVIKVASLGGEAIAEAISAKTGERYSFKNQGKVSGGSELWFGIEPEKDDGDVYQLGFRVEEGSGGTKWDTVLKVGDEYIDTVSGVDPGALESAVSRLRVEGG